MTNMLRVENINVYYDNIHAIKDLSLDVKEGEIVSLIGANGAGKTTILKTISGLLRARDGSIVFLDEEISKTPAHNIVRRGLSQVPEGRQVFQNLSVRDNLILGGFTSDASEAEQKEIMEEFFQIFPVMKERIKQRAGTLSGGEQQMLAMGRAIASRPKLLLLDEPSMGLSPLYVKEIFKVIEELNARGTTILLVEQNARMALSIADRAYVLETGKIVAQGPAADLADDEAVKKAYLGA